jgi:lipopolysaccharide/colanic/teichoic acid biosynthesis glycosyltransferase
MHELYARLGKRGFDLAAAASLLLALAPLMAAVALAVRLALGPGVLFAQTRAGRRGAPFTLWKFRSLAHGDAPDEQRLTRFGRALRASGLDELPQLWCVLRGDMSLVGPRPLPPDYTGLFGPRQALRLGVRPGLFGLAQAAGRNAVPWAERLELDARYAEAPPRLPSDLALIARCVALVLAGRGVTAPGHATMPRFAGTTNPARVQSKGKFSPNT